MRAILPDESARPQGKAHGLAQCKAQYCPCYGLDGYCIPARELRLQQDREAVVLDGRPEEERVLGSETEREGRREHKIRAVRAERPV